GSSTVHASTPASGTITELTPTASYTAGPFLVPNPTPTPVVGSGPTCDMAHPCDSYTLNISLPANYQATHPNDVVAISVSWPTLPGNQADFDMYVYDSPGARATSSAGSNDPEIAFLPAVSGRFTITVVPFDPQGQSILGTITLGPAPVSGIGEGIYTSSSDVWSLNKHLTGDGLVFSHAHDAEPAVRIGKDGQTWVAANGGVFGTSGIGLWRITDDCAQNFTFLEPETPLYNGGGDVDVEVAPEKNPLGFYNVYTS